MTFSPSLATFCRPNSSFTLDCLQQHVHIHNRRDYDKQKAVVVVQASFNMGNAQVRECISEA